MGTDRILSTIAAILGLSGSVLLARGTLKLSARVVAKVCQTRVDYNSLLLANITSQKADYVSGIPLILAAFVVQVLNLLFVRDSLKTYSFFEAAFLIACSAVPTLVIGLFVNRFLVKKYRIDSLKYLVKPRLEDNLKQGRITKYGYEDYTKEAERLFCIKREEGESRLDFLRRYLQFLGIEVRPADLGRLQIDSD